jgi:hypothetical protein
MRHVTKSKQRDQPHQALLKIIRKIFQENFVRFLPLFGLAGIAISLAGAPKAEALNTVCTAVWTPPDVSSGTKSAPIQGANPSCPAAPITATVQVGAGGAGQIVTPAWNTLAATNQYPTTSQSGIIVGSAASSFNDLTVTFSQRVSNPYFYASLLTFTESITFSSPFTILQSSGVTVSGSTITGSGTSAPAGGFVAQFIGDYSQLGFRHSTNTSAYSDGFAFTTGLIAAPGPLPILGVGAALGQARRLRRLSQRRR